MSEVIAVIGLGSIAKKHRANLKMLYPKAKIFALPSRRRIVEKNEIDNADSVVNSVDQLIDLKPKFVIDASPSSMHFRNSSLLIQNLIPVLIEKPIASTLSDSEKLISLSKKFKLPLAVGYCLRQLPSALMVKQLLEDLGEQPVYNVQATVGQYLPDWRGDVDFRESVSARAELGGGVLLELSHELDYLQWLLGPLKVEHAILRSSNELSLEVEEIADITLKTNDGGVCNLHLDFLQRHSHRKCSFVCAGKRIDWDLITNSVVVSDKNGIHDVYSEPEWDKNNMYIAMLKNFNAFIHGESEQIASLQEAHDVIKIITRIKEIAIWGGKL